MLNFVAIDFETANKFPNSALSLACTVVENGAIKDTWYSLIKPPFQTFDPDCTAVHGIQPKEVANAPTFDQLWPDIYETCLKDRIILAHNARFDVGVLRATLDHYKLAWPDNQFADTVKIARKVWPTLVNHKLNTVGTYLGVKFRHHYALDDAETCAKIATAAAKKTHTNSLPELLSVIKVPLEDFIEDNHRARQAKLQEEEAASQQTSLF